MLKRITLLALAFIGCMAMNAQSTIFSEDFTGTTDQTGVGSLPDLGWTIYTEDSNTPHPDVNFIDEAWKIVNFTDVGEVMASTSYFSASGQADRWAVTPEMTIPATNATLFYEVLSGDPNNPEAYEILVSTTGNSPSDFTDAAVFSEDPAPSGGMSPRSVSLEDYVGEDIYIAFHSIGSNGYLLAVDNIAVKELLDTELELASINTPAIVASGNNDITGTVVNNGADAITSFDVTWSVDGGTDNTQTLSGLNIETLASYDFTHDDQWDASAGDHTLDVTISNINGNGDDDDTSNDALSQDMTVATNSVQRKPLYEEFTSSSCGPCEILNSGLYTPFFNSLNDDEYSLVKYQVNFPGVGDPYYTAEVGVRRSYYGVNAAPTMLREGHQLPQTPFNTQQALQDDFDEAMDDPAFFDMQVDASRDGTTIEATVTATSYLTGEFTLQVAVVEKQTFDNASTNGETEFEHVMMKMMPDAQGTTMQFTADQSETITLTPVDMTGTNTEEFNDLQVVAFIQDPNSKKIMQSVNSADVLSVKERNFDGLTMYPNPTNGVLNISAKTPVDVNITNMLGDQVLVQQNVGKEDQIDVSNLTSGIYFVTIKQDSTSTTKKLIVE